MMLAPFHPVAAAEILHRTVTYVEQVLDDLVGTRQIDRTRRIGEAEFLLGSQVIDVLGFVVFDIAARSLIREPLPDVPRIRPRVLGQLLCRQTVPRERGVQAELVTDQHQNRTHRRPEIPDRLTEKCVESVFGGGHRRLLCSPDSTLDRSASVRGELGDRRPQG